MSYPPQGGGQPPQQPPQPHQQYPYPPQPPRKSWPRRHKVAATLLSLLGAFVLLGIIGAILGGGNGTSPTGAGQTAVPVTTSASQSSAPSPTPAVTTTRVVRQVVFKVKGSAPSGVDITYGNDSSNLSPSGNPDAPLPWRGSMKFTDSAFYWDVSAQLQGGGDVTCAVGVKVTTYWSDGTHASKTKWIASGHAVGGYNICSAQTS